MVASMQEITMIDDKLKLNAKSKFAMYMEAHKMRKTPERFAILDMAMSFGEHFSADVLYRRMEEDSYHVSRATIYNTLDLLTDCGILRRHRFGSNQSQYECMADTLNHHHLICTECGKIKEIKDAELIEALSVVYGIILCIVYIRRVQCVRTQGKAQIEY